MAQPGLDDDPFGALRDQIRSTADAADRLADEAARDPSGARASGRAAEAGHEAQALVSLLTLLRDVLPEDLRQQIADLIRQVLLLVRAVIDYCVLRLEAGPPAPRTAAPVPQDIPLD
jgi:hypothetical protein